MDRRLALTSVASAAAATAATVIARAYRHDLANAYARLDAVERDTVATDLGVIEFVDRGDGPPLLVSHGIFHGCDGGLLAVRDTVIDRRVIVPSRFGYLGSTLPDGASSADQADAFVSLLDHLELAEVDVIGISAGTSAVVQSAIRHPDRVRRLVISSGNLPGSPTAIAPPAWATVFYSDPAMWTLRTAGRAMIHRLMGVPSGFPHGAEQAATVDELVESIFPLAPRRDGAIFDAFVSNPEIEGMSLESVDVPTLVVHAEDDPLASYDAAARAAERIPDATLLTLESGGHLALGQSGRVRAEIERFLGATSPR